MRVFIIILLMSTFFGTNTCQAQDENVENKEDYNRFEFGVRLIPTISKVQVQSSTGGTISGEGTLGFGVGGIFGINFTEHVGFETNLLYFSITQKYKEADLDREIKITYFTLPFMLSLNTGKQNPVNLMVEMGPQFGLNIGSQTKTSGDTLQTILSTKRSNVGIAIGTGLGFILNPAKTTRLDIGYLGLFSKQIKTNSIYVGFTLLF